MRGSNITLFFLVTYFFLQAQNYTPFPSNTAVWTSSYCNFATTFPIGGHYKAVMSGDTTIVMLDYRKIYYSNDSIFMLDNAIYMAALREVDKKIYYVPKSSISEYLLYDFTKETGDTLETYAYDHLPPDAGGTIAYRTLVIDYTDSIFLDGAYRKRYYFPANSGYHQEEYWIEGFGSTFGLFQPFLSITDASLHLSCFTENDQLIYSNLPPDDFCGDLTVAVCEDEIATNVNNLNLTISKYLIYPNPTTGILQIESEHNQDMINRIVVFNTLGQLFRSFNNINLSNVELNLVDISSGAYFLKIINSDNKSTVKKIVIHH